jgi:hypothetical protein
MLYKRRPEKQFHFFKTAPLKLQNTRIIPKNSRGQQLLEICTRVGKRNRCLSEYEKIRRYGFRKTSPEEGIQHLCPLKPKPPKIRRQRPTTLSVSSSAQHTLCQKKKKVLTCVISHVVHNLYYFTMWTSHGLQEGLVTSSEFGRDHVRTSLLSGSSSYYVSSLPLRVVSIESLGRHCGCITTHRLEDPTVWKIFTTLRKTHGPTSTTHEESTKTGSLQLSALSDVLLVEEDIVEAMLLDRRGRRRV